MLESSPLPAKLTLPLDSLKTRHLALACVRAIGVAVMLFLAGAVLVGWTDLIVDLSANLRLGLVVALLVGAALTLIAAVLQARRKTRPQDLARTLDRVGRTGGQICAGVELAST